MSVLVKDMRMPKSCYEIIDGDFKFCPFMNNDSYCVLLLEKGIHAATFNDQYSKCPLVEVPKPHGRLIDKDRLKREMLWNFAGEKIPLYDCDNNPVDFHVKDVEATINSQPTVIEAEGEE